MPRPSADPLSPAERGTRGLLVVGIGNPLGGDDAVGPVVAEHVCALLGGRAEYAPLYGGAFDLLALLRGREAAVVIDAFGGGRLEEGELARLEPTEAWRWADSGPSSHSAGALSALPLAREVGAHLPQRLWWFAIGVGEVGEFRPWLSGKLARRVPEMAREIVEELGC